MTKQEAKQQIAKLIEKYQRLVDTRKVKSYNEAQTRNEFIEPLFEFLGWDMRNLENPNEVTTEETVSKGRVDLAFRLNHIPVMFLEAKALKVDLDEWKWAEQAINYSWNKSVTWAILSDFEGIKVFNAEIPPKSLSQNLFFELKWHEYLDRFDQLWLLSKESFEEKKLAEQAEKWGKLTKRKQVGEKLFEDLTTWRALLTKDFKKNNSNIDDDALDEGVQKVLDRLIFIRTAEDRKIEQNILLSLVREWETAGKKHNIFKRLNDGFRWFDDHYNSKLFASHALENWKADDKVFETIIKGLYQTADGYRYDFSAISTDVLGGIYEQYLGYVQEKAQKDDKKKSKRKSQGIYYTPRYIVEYLIEQTLGEVLKKAKAKDIPNIKILDPACGSGSFLITAYDKMLEAKTKLDKQTGLFDRFEILKNNIYGVDLDEQAIEIAQLNLLLRVLSQRTKLPTLSHNIRIGNSLVEGETEKLQEVFGDKWREQKAFNWKDDFPEVFKNEGFDVIIGNPPYVNLANIKDSSFREWLKKEFKTAKNKSDLYSFFTEKAISLLKPKGKMGFIFSNSWLGTDSFSKFREFLINETKVLKLVKLPPGVFNDATVTTILIFIEKSKAAKKHQIVLEELKDQKFVKLPYKLSYERIFNTPNFGFSFSPEIKLRAKTILLGDIASFSLGIKTSNDERFIFDERKDENSYKILRGKDVSRYSYGWGGKWIWYKPDLIIEKVGGRPRKIENFLTKKIIIKDVAENVHATLDKSNYLNNDTLNVIYELKKYSFEFILAILNSRFIAKWFKTNFQAGLHIKINQLQQIPIPEASEKEQAEIAKLAELMLNLQKEAHEMTGNTDKHARLKTEIEKLDEKIDRAIYKLYDLTDEEIATIEKTEAK
ncbi:hypothetical protein COY05_01460 [Candidatus Peregrinibacteria bacterium CG_4_10_14_0_2_um_filter_38_24]|nr:MAG: hypothetical protein COY05_01460 [Candidatus Peregrinibacteria bacterium CG_4_10_14_0_2_um_filter_38_24]